MTPTELKKIIADSRSKEWFINKTQGISFPYINFNTEIKGVSSIYEFSIQQINGWESLSSNLPEELHFSKNYFIAIKDSISQFVESYFDQENNTLDSYWNNVISQINNVSRFPLTYNCPESEFLISVYKNLPNSVTGAFYYITNQLNSNIINTKNYYVGTQLAYEFTMKDHTEISSRRNAEKSSISNIRNDFNKYLSKSENEIVEHLSNTNRKYEEYS